MQPRHRIPLVHATSVALALAAPLACSDDGITPFGSGGGDDGGGDGSAGTSTTTSTSTTTAGGQETGAEPENGPLEGGFACGDEIAGWQIKCDPVEAARSYTNPLTGQMVTLSPELGSGFATICCQGSSPKQVADDECTDKCVQQLCAEAQAQHLAWAADIPVAASCFADSNPCGFSMAACLTGEIHGQQIQDGTYTGPEYWLRVSCKGAATAEPIDGHWPWVELPVNNPDNDIEHPMCFPTSDIEFDPNSVVQEYSLTESAGTMAQLAWSRAGSNGIEDTLDVAVDAAYAAVACGANDTCIELAQVHAEIPTMTVQGLTIKNAQITLERVKSNPIVSHGAFTVPHRSVRATMSGTVNSIPLLLTGFNEGSASGQVSPAGNFFTLNGLVFDYDDGDFSADLHVDIGGAYSERRPEAAISVLFASKACSAGVTFDAVSFDPDAHQNLEHTWWIPPNTLTTGDTVTLPLAPGEHVIHLISQDPTGRTDAAALRYQRWCW